MPLRSMLRLPDGSGLLGLMPGYLGAPQSFGLKVVTVMPGNHGTLYDSHQGVVMLFGVAHGEPLAILDATAITAIRTAAASAAATDALARAGCRRPGAPRLWHAGAHPPRGDAERAPAAPRARVEPHAGPRRAASRARRARARASRSRWRAAPRTRCGRRPDLHHDRGARARARGRVARARRPRQRGRRVLPASRELDTEAVRRARFFTDCRESCLNESGDFLLARAEGAIGDDHLLGEIGDVFLGRSSAGSSRDDITVFESLGIAVEDLAAAHYIHRTRGHRRRNVARVGRSGRSRMKAGALTRRRDRRAGNSRMTPAPPPVLHPPTREEILAARARIPGTALRTPLVRLPTEPGEPEIWLKLESLQPIGSFKIRGAANAMGLAPARRAGARRLHRERGQHGAGRRLVRARGWRAVRRRRPRPRAAGQARRDRAPRRAHRSGAVRALVAGAGRATLRGHGGALRPPGERPGRDRGQRHDRARDPRGPARGRDASSCPTAAAGCRAASPPACARPDRRARVRLRGRDRGPAGAARSPPARPPRSTTGRASSTASAGAACSPRCGRSPPRSWPAASSSGSRRSPPRSASLVARARVVAEGAGAASLAAAFAGRPATGAGGAAVPRPEGPVVCVVSGGNLDPARLATILEGRLP